MPPRCPEGSWKYIRASCSRRRRSRNSRACSLTRWPTLPSTTLPACSGSRNRCRSRCLRRSFWGCSRRARIPTWPRRSLPVQEPPASSHSSITPVISSARPTGSAFSSCNRRASTSAAWVRSSNGCRKRRGCTRTTRRPICALTRSPASASPTCRIARRRLPTSRRPTASSSPLRALSCAPSRACRARPSLISRSWCASIATPTRPARATDWPEGARVFRCRNRGRIRAQARRDPPHGGAPGGAHPHGCRGRGGGARGVARRPGAGSQLSAASLRLCGGAAGIGTAPGRARLARGAGEELPPRRPAVRHAGQILRRIRQTTPAPSGACRKLCSAGYLAGGNRAAAARAEKRGRRFLSTLRRRGPLAGSARAAGRRGETPLGEGRAFSRRFEVGFVEKIERLLAFGKQLFVAVAAPARSLEQRVHSRCLGNRRSARIEKMHERPDFRERLALVQAEARKQLLKRHLVLTV